jgi:OOP family OmpA-OmpF porin
MKTQIFTFIFLLSVCLTNAQIGNQLKNKLLQKRDAKINEAIDKGINSIGNKPQKQSDTDQSTPEAGNTQNTQEPEPEPEQPVSKQQQPVTSVNPEKSYAKFDFIPGEKVMFEDNFISETPDEVPSFWIPTSGQVEISIINGEKVMGFLKDGKAYPRRSTKNRNAIRTTLEFDYLFRRNDGTWRAAEEAGNTRGESFYIQFANDEDYYDSQIQDQLGDFKNRLVIHAQGAANFGQMSSNYSTGTTSSTPYGKIFDELTDKWVHASVAITERSLKLYLNSQRVINAVITKGSSLTFQFNCEDCSTEEDGHQLFIRNVRIAEGGADPYKQLMSDGRLITHGITFDVAKASIKPESFGTLNTIVSIMKDNADVKFEVGGHTDSDGEDASNMKLSQQRADAVREKLISMGIDGSRLTSKGYGESKPLVPNSTPENKANNRRVEFVKI